MIWALSLLTMDLSTHRLTPGIQVCGIRSLTGLGNPWRAPHPISALPPVLLITEASPKAISGRTSYLRVRLAFHLHPQVIPQLFNAGGFGPPRDITLASPCPWIGHSVSGLLHATRALFRLAFAPATFFSNLTLPHASNSSAHSSKGTPSGYRL